jgi:ubiquinone/menaquinone biosynthesis C-methylase UbiE
MSRFHPESPDVSSEALSRLRFVADFRKQLHSGLSKGNRAVYQTEVAGHFDADAPLPERRDAIRDAMEAQPYYRGWSSMLRGSQDLMWRLVGNSVAPDRERLDLRLKSLSNAAKGSVTLDPATVQPDYMDEDVHRMPGGYVREVDEDQMRAGALYDLGGAVYQLGIGNKTGGLLNDSRGRTLVAHLASRFPELKPTRILDMGCGVGHNTVPLAAAFPEAETVGIDLGAPLLRYAHLRAEGLETPVTFIQDNAEHTRFPDGGFDVVVSQIILHETSPEATAQIIKESRRLLRSGGVGIHLEVPLRHENGDDFDQFIRMWEQYYNAEPNIDGVMDGDFVGMMTDAGFMDVKQGYQAIPPAGSRVSAFTPEPAASQFAHWFIVSGRAA